MACRFCNVPENAVTAESENALAFLDAWPVTDGHTLVIPRRHVESIYELTPDEQAEIWRLVAEVRTLLIADCVVQHFNIGVNDGTDAGQTMDHAHVHVIPRRAGDVADPRGGIRWVIPDLADYWSE